MSSWEGFLTAFKNAVDALKLGPGEEALLRGQPNTRWQLTPTLLRYGLDERSLIRVESDLFFEFRAHARELHGLNLSDWDVLFYMRHYGVPTRLLDWTDSLGVALWFALDSYKGGTDEACIWILNPYRLNDDDLFEPRNLGWDEQEKTYYDYGELLVEPDPVAWNSPLAVYPNKNNPRLFSQRGYFTIHGKDLRPLDEIAAQDGYLTRISLPIDAVDDAREFLRMAGLDRYRIYGDLESLAAVLVSKIVGGATEAPRGETVPRTGSRRPRRP